MKNYAALLALSLLAVTLPVRADQLADAKALASQLVQRLGATLKQEMSAHGPDGAVGVCLDVAPSIASELSRQSGGKVARVSLKTRNPLLGTPDAWEQQVLMEFDRRAAAGEKPEALEFSENVSEPNGRYLRYMKALPVQPLCLSCHGASESIPDAVKAKLAADYPHDRATGYEAGAVRGAVTVKLPAGATP
jgi:hypothetical protein